ncbi:type I polyketide synthase [Tumebacillus flagellatus]|uniref:Uncharacterized protein n=1 Tax=Tumebacillus flagellatus TaxID=1157490 RepID=A0A074LK99_9BACL|nr:type I polyketide synthase [Tumebacillus flagellatus]KEO82566.1 hypothetical protein EL26_14360 [Tumebacillus flagellatus]
MEPIAIIGMACRFPGADGVDSFWELIKNGVDAIQEVPNDRWRLDTFYDESRTRPGTMSTRYGGFLSRISEFDAQFFGISPREAANMDPQQRLLLETAWEALESAGLVPKQLAGSKTGVFVGIMNYDYGNMQSRNPEDINPHSGPGSQGCMAANRLSYFFDFRGPSLSIDTACSSSLVAVHQACLSLQSDNAGPIALACGVNVILSPTGNVFFSTAGLMTADGRAKTFDASANGFARSEGVGVLVLKPLAKALEEGDPVLAVIRGSAINQDGRTNGIMAPNRFSQEALLRETYARAGINPSQIQYVETHGTGTLLGDPIEANALGTVLSEGRDPEDRCPIGSVKTNIGHTESAASMASVIKVVQMLRHKLIPPSLHFQTPNPYIPFDSLPLRVPTELEPWPQGTGSRLAGVSSFGFGGTNAHLVLEEAPASTAKPARPASADRSAAEPFLLPLSARHPDALRALSQSYLQRLTENSDLALDDVVYTASLKRTQHDYRLAIVSDSTEQLIQQLQTYLAQTSHPDLVTGHRAPARQLKLVYVFTGQGSQWWGMGRQLLQNDSFFEQKLIELSKQYETISSISVLDELLAQEEHTRLDQTCIAQPALVLLQVALVEWLRAHGVEPHGVIGHSIGEVTAAYIAGILTLDQTLQLLHHRSRIMQKATGTGRMATVRLSAEEAVPYLQGLENRVKVAVVNEPASCVLAGDTEAMAELEATFHSASVTMRYLPVQYAFHSPQLEPYQAELQQALDFLTPQKASLKIWSTRTGKLSDGTEYDASYWGRQMCERVQFSAAVQACALEGITHFIEIGPHPVLTGQIKKCLHHIDKTGLIVPTLHREEGERRQLLRALGTLHANGYNLNWNRLSPRGQVVRLPAYPWQREHFWFEPNATAADFWERTQDAPIDKTLHPLLGSAVSLAHPMAANIWQSQVNKSRHPWLDDHRIQGKVVVPGTSYLEIALAALRAQRGDGVYTLRNLETRRAFFLEDQEKRFVQTWLSEPDRETGVQNIAIYSSPADERDPKWIQHAQGSVAFTARESHVEPAPLPLYELLARFPDAAAPSDFYRDVAGKGLEYGPTFRSIDQLYLGNGEALAHLRLHEKLHADAGRFLMHPALLDACGHLLLATDEVEAGSDLIYMPVGIREVRVYGSFDQEVWSHASLKHDEQGPQDRVVGQIRIFDGSGRVLAEMDDLEFQRIGTWKKRERHDTFDSWLYEVQWEETPLPATPAEQQGLWLMLCDTAGVGDALADLWQQQGRTCIRLYSGDSFQELGPLRFAVDPAREEDIRQALQIAYATLSQEPLAGALHLWSLDIPIESMAQKERLSLASRLALQSSVALVKTLSSDPLARRTKVHFVTRGAQAVDSTSSVHVNQAPLWGLARSLPMEHPHLWGGLLDLDPNASSAQSAEWLNLTIGKAHEEDQTAIRNGRLYNARLRTPDKAKVLGEPTPISEDGTYLISGGLGGLGLETAKWLAKQGARHLLLLGRTPMAPRSEWAQLDPASRQGMQAATLLDLEQQGVQVETAAVDVSDAEQIRACLHQRSERGVPAVRGVFHLAGNAEGSLLTDLSAQTLSNILSPKLAGAWALHTALEGAELDCFVLFSSASSLMPSPMISAYGAANASLDAFAHYRRSLGLPALSINWGPFAQVGMAMQNTQNERQSFGALQLIQPEEALDGMRRLLAGSGSQLAVFPINREMWYQLYERNRTFPLLRALSTAPVKKAEVSASALKVDHVENYVSQQVANVLRLSVGKLDVQESMLNLGMDSLMLTELKNRIETDLNVSLPLVKLLQGPSVHQLSEMIREQQQEETAAETAAAAEATIPDELEAEQLLDQLDDMSEEEIERLLSLMADEEVES